MNRIRELKVEPVTVKSGEKVRVSLEYEGGGTLIIEPDRGFAVAPTKVPLGDVVSGSSEFDVSVTRTTSTERSCELLFQFGMSERGPQVEVV